MVHVVSGGGSKLTSVGRSWFTEVSAKRLHFMMIDVDRDTLAARVIDDDGDVFDEFTVTSATVSTRRAAGCSASRARCGVRCR